MYDVLMHGIKQLTITPTISICMNRYITACINMQTSKNPTYKNILKGDINPT